MLKIERQNLIDQELRKAGYVLVPGLSEMLCCSEETVRRDLREMEMAGKLGQALDVSLDELATAPFSQAEHPREPMRGKHVFGLVTVGDKGQIVIPVQARRIFHIKPGDQMMVLGDEDRGLALLDAKFFLKVAEVMQHGDQ